MSATIAIRQATHGGQARRFTPTTAASSPDVSARALSERTYRWRRAVVGTTLAVLVAVSTVLAHDVLAGSGGVPASAATSQPALVRATVTAQSGDTLWSIAETRHGAVPITRYVDKLVDLNGGASIQAGQAVVLP
jgi:LysM repeat protein